jgi:hypothetical protein
MPSNGGFGLEMWGAMVDRDGTVCAIAYTGSDRGAQWPGSRMIAAQKAYTANAFSLPGLALSTANLYYATQPGGSLYGLQHSNPVDPALAYLGPAANFGTASDPMDGYRVGGVNVFGGGLALYNKKRRAGRSHRSQRRQLLCRSQHRVENPKQSGLDYVPGGVSGDPMRPDNIVFDLVAQAGQQSGTSMSGWGHPLCGVTTMEKSDAASLPPISK